MNIGVIGTGDIGAVIVKTLRDAGYPVKMANSKGPDSLRELAAKTGAIPVSVEEEMIPGQNKSLLNSLIDLDLILLWARRTITPLIARPSPQFAAG
jgi:3-hydroxyacyl-CoA dehydrogenase